MRYRYWAGIGASLLLGLILLVSGAGKIAEPAELLAVLNETSVLPETAAALAAQWLPWLELVLGILLVMGISAKFMASASGLLAIGFIFNNSRAIEQGLEINGCGCFGVFEIGIISSFEAARYMDIGMLALTLIILLCYPGKFFETRPWFLAKRKTASGSDK